jgi:hypothetical protein
MRYALKLKFSLPVTAQLAAITEAEKCNKYSKNLVSNMGPTYEKLP